jgi:hypothetical protein
MSDTQRSEPDESPESSSSEEVELPDDRPEDKVNTQLIPLEDAPFTAKELRRIKIGVAVQIEAQRMSAPIEVIVPVQPEPSFSGTYNRRPHWIAGVQSNIVAPILITGTWVLTFALGSMVLSSLNSFPEFNAFMLKILNRLPRLKEYVSNLSYDSWISIWIPAILASLVTLFILWVVAKPFLEWFYEKRTVTETQVVLSRNVPGFLRNLFFSVDDIVEKINRKDVRNVKIETTGIGELLGYATVTFETWSQTDTAFHKIPFVSHTSEIRTLFPIDNLGAPDTTYT